MYSFLNSLKDIGNQKIQVCSHMRLQKNTEEKDTRRYLDNDQKNKQAKDENLGRWYQMLEEIQNQGSMYIQVQYHMMHSDKDWLDMQQQLETGYGLKGKREYIHKSLDWQLVDNSHRNCIDSYQGCSGKLHGYTGQDCIRYNLQMVTNMQDSEK